MGKKFSKKRQKRKNRKPKSTYQRVQSKEIPVEEALDSEREISLEDARRLGSLSKLGATGNLLGKRDLKTGKTSGEPVRKKQRNQNNEESYEAIPREAKWDDKQEIEYLLPIKSKDGIIHQIKKKKAEVEIDDSDYRDSMSEPESILSEGDNKGNKSSMIDEVEEDLSELTTVELFARREKKLNEKKELIGTTASKLVEDPESNIGLLKTLRSLCVEREPEVCITVRKLAMVSTMAVFKDIVPGYRIREPTEEDKKVKLSKDVKKLREFEQTLLTNYTQYLSILEETIQAGISGAKNDKRFLSKEKMSVIVPSDETSLPSTSLNNLAVVATECVCELMTSLTHFNYRNNIFAVVVSLISTPAVDDKLFKLSCDAVRSVFEKDLVGESSLELVKLITQTIKSKKYKVDSKLFDTFLSLNLHDVTIGGQSEGHNNKKFKKDMTTMSKKERKRMKSVVKLKRELKETEAVESKEKRTKLQTEILKLLFSTYFHVLKYNSASSLISSVLEGLAKFSHLISVDFFVDLLTVLETCISSGMLSQRQCLQCILTAFEILSGQGEALNIDPRKFYTHFYAILLQLDVGMEDEDISLAIKCLDRMLHKRKQVSLQRVLSYIKRMATVSLHVVPAASLSLMSSMRQFLNKYPRTDRLLDNESASLGVFKPDVVDPELSCADSAVLWELPLLTKHYDPLVREYATHLSLGAPSQGKGTLQSSFTKCNPDEFLRTHSLFTLDPFVKLPSDQTKQTKGGPGKQNGEYPSTFNQLYPEYETKWNESADAGLKQLKHSKSSLCD